MILHDIETENDIELLINSFYNKVQKSEVLAPFFLHVNWQHHLPRMIHFWSFVLLGTQGFTGNVFDAHTKKHIKETHFTAWLALFNTTVDELFEGKNANLAKQKANELGMIFSWKLKELEA